MSNPHIPIPQQMQQLRGSPPKPNPLTEIIAAANKDRDIAAARITVLEAQQLVLLEYASHLNSCSYRHGHDCDCGLDEIRALAPEQDK